MEKVLVEVYLTYGKRDGHELGESYVEDDSKETREEVFENWSNGALNIEGDVESFKAGSVDSLFVERDGGDWDEPTGVGIVLTTYSQKRGEIELDYGRKIEKLNRQFKVEEK